MTRAGNRASSAAGSPASDVPPLVDILALAVAGFTIYTFLEMSLVPVHAGCMTLAFLYLLPQGVLTAARPSREVRGGKRGRKRWSDLLTWESKLQLSFGWTLQLPNVGQ